MPVEVAGDLQRAAPLPVDPAPEDLANLARQPLPEVLDHLPDQRPRHVQHLGSHQVAKREDGLEQLVTRLHLLQDIRVGDQLGHAVTLQRVPFQHFDRLTREELADVLEPIGNRQHAGARCSGPIFAVTPTITHAALAVLAAVQEVEPRSMRS